MSLLSEEVSLVGQAQELVSKELTIVYPPVTTHLSLLSGIFKQAVGYMYPRPQDGYWTYVVDVNTGKPLQLPQGHLPLFINCTPIQNLAGGEDNDWYLYFVDSPTDPGFYGAYSIDSWSSNDINNKTCDDVTGSSLTGETYLGYNYIAFYNDYYPDLTFTTGCVKVVVEYI